MRSGENGGAGDQASAGGREVAGLLEMLRRLARARSQDEVSAALSEAARTLVHADGAIFVLRDGDHCRFAAEEAVSPLWRGRRVPMRSSAAGWAMERREPLAIPDIRLDPRVVADAYRPSFVRALAVVPVGLDEPLAALSAYWSETHETSSAELQTLQDIAEVAALVVSRLLLEPTAAGEATQDAAAPPPRASARPRELGWLAALGHRLVTDVRPNSLEAYLMAAACVIIATLLREGVRASGVKAVVIFATYYPAAVLATVSGGKRAGLFAAALGGFAAYYFFMPPFYRFVVLSASDAVNLGLYGASCALIVLIIDWYQRAVLRLREEDARHLTLAREQRHRVRNALAVVEAIVRQSLRDAPERARAINQRVRAGLADVDVRDPSTLEPIGVRELLVVELDAYDLERFDLAAEPDGRVQGDARTLLALAVHELATNALKYGALSSPAGRIAIAWSVAGGRVTLRWREADGPEVAPPRKRGYGSILLHRLVEGAGGAFDLRFLPEGVEADISLPLRT